MLLLACDNGNVQMVRYLLGLEEVDVSACTADGKTGLHLAAIHDYPELAQELIQHHISLTAQDAKVKGVRTLEMSVFPMTSQAVHAIVTVTVMTQLL